MQGVTMIGDKIKILFLHHWRLRSIATLARWLQMQNKNEYLSANRPPDMWPD